MGSAGGKNVRERHSRALYVNIPVSRRVAQALVARSERVEPDVYGDSCWLSYVVDDLDRIEAWIGCGFLPVPLAGWMAKMNLLVRCKPPVGDDHVPAYQILTLDFEAGAAGGVKVSGARSTQRVPSEQALFTMSDGTSGASRNAPFTPGASYSAEVRSSPSGKGVDPPLLRLGGKLRALGAEERDFARFVAERPHKVLAQDGGKTSAYAPEAGEGASFSADEMLSVQASELALSPLVLERLRAHATLMLAARGRSDEGEVLLSEADLDLSKAVLLFQPEYILIDHHNVELADNT